MASTAVPPSRLVRCPKCRNVLPEVTDVPLYQCAVCDTILLAKNFRARGVSSASSDSVFTSSHMNELDHGSEKSLVNSNGESVVLGEEPADSTDAGNTSNSEDGCHETGENLKNGNGTGNRSEIGDETMNCLGGQTAKNLNLEKDESEIGDEAIKCLDGELEKNQSTLGNDESETSRSEDNKEDFVESSSQKTVSEENPVDGDFNNGASSGAISPTNTGSPAYEGSVSSFDCRCDSKLAGTRRQLLSRRTFRPRSVPGSPQSGKVPGGGVSLQETALVSEPLKMTCGSDDMGSFKSDSVESTSRHDWTSHGQKASGTSEELFHSLENSMELAKGELFSSQQIGPNDSPSSKFRDIEHGRMELLRKVDDLRFQLIGSFDQRSDVDRKSQINGSRRTRRPPRPPLLGSRESEQELLGPSLPALRPKKYPYHCVNCHLVPPQGIFCSKGLCMSCCHPSISAGYHFHLVSDPLSSHKNPKHDNEVVKQPTKVKDQTMKRHCRPISGGANFIICSECLFLLQMPDDFHISNTSSNKLRCGSCYHVLTFSFPKRGHGTRVFRGNRGVPYDYGEYGPSSSGSYTPEDEHVLHVSRNSIDSAVELHQIDSAVELHQLQHPRLHRLMGYCSASEIIYQPSDGEHLSEA